MQDNQSTKPDNQWEGREVCQGRDFCDVMAQKRQMSWCQPLVSSAFHNWLNLQENLII